MKDRFSTVAAGYSQYRPTYPPALIDWLLKHTPTRNFAIECGTGSGQLTKLLAPHFESYLATDISTAQMSAAQLPPNVEIQVTPAHQLPVPDQSTPLLIAAQASHWFDLPAFYSEAERVLQPGGLLALIGYGLITISPEIDAIVYDIYDTQLGSYWDHERQMVDNHYRDYQFPYPELTFPDLALETEWDAAHLIGYLQTWSGVANWRKANPGQPDPVEQAADQLTQFWGDGRRRVSFPLFGRVGHKSA